MKTNLDTLPEPCGDYLVGISHTEYQYGGPLHRTRTVPATFFYPADSAENGCRAPYGLPEILPCSQHMFRGKVGINILETRTHCYQNIPISGRLPDYPVIIFNHGYTGYEMQNTVLCSDLASSGFIVLSLGHPGESAAVRFSDGRVELVDPLIMSEQDKRQEDPNLRAALQAVLQADGEKACQEAVSHLYSLETVLNDHLPLWVEDTIEAANHLEALHNGHTETQLKGKFRLSRGIGLTGHSFGGATAAQACRDDARFICGINIDGGSFGDFFGQDIRKPFLTIGSEPVWKLSRTVFDHNSEDVYHLVIEKTAHIGFTDMIFIARQLQEDGWLGEYDMFTLRYLLSNYHLRFFERYLLGNQDASLEELTFPGATLYVKCK